MRTTVYYRLSLTFKTVPKVSAIIISFQIWILITRKIKCMPKGTQSHTAKLESTPVTVSRVFVFCSVYYSQPIPHPLESLQLCLYHSGVFLPLSVMCFASLRCGHVFSYYPPETPVSFKETTPCHCPEWILLEAVLHSDSHLAHSVCIIQITLPILPMICEVA